MKNVIIALALLFAVGCGTAEGSDDLPNVGPAPTDTGGSKGDVTPSGTGSSCGCEAGPQGEVGPAGPQGPQGAQGDPGQDGQDGLDGDSCTVGLAGSNQVAVTCGNTEQILTAVAGPKGDTGATGAQGIQGVPGTPGAKGADGKNGVVDPSTVYKVGGSGNGTSNVAVAYCDAGDLMLTGGCEAASALWVNTAMHATDTNTWYWYCKSTSSIAILNASAWCIDVDGNH